jgi:hypothetical protein
MIWMPYQDYRRSAKCLSDQHLREQRVACRKIIGVMFNGQRRDIATWMVDWSRCSDAVLWATDATLREMTRRRLPGGPFGETPWMLIRGTEPPVWLGREEAHRTHKEMLMKADPQHYGRMGWRL